MKYLCVVFASFLFTLFGNALTLMATDDVLPTRLDSSNVVETVPLPEPDVPEDDFPASPIAGTNTIPLMPTVYSESYIEPVASAVSVVETYTVSYHVGSVSEYNAIAYNLSYSDIYKYRKMVYGHNSSNLLASLAWKNLGDVVIVNEGGVSSSYQIVWKDQLVKESDTTLSGYSMSSIANALGLYDIAFVTCAGYGDTPYRWVLFGNRV